MSKIVKWEDKVIYQIFPRSFYDSSNDGNGDIKGITQKMKYLGELGIGAIWLCPTYKTNFADAGYDVIDYKTVWKQFGTLEDFKKMTKEAAKYGIEIIMDIVLNHVSNEHPWFKKACKSVDNVEHNYFIWRKTLNKDEKAAQSIFGGSAWEYVPAVKKYYFHLFAKEQVDLNWNHPDTIAAMASVIDFWYEIGVKGFRLDAIKHISKDFPEGNENDFSWGKDVVPQLQKFNKVAFGNKPDSFILGEASSITLKEAIKYGTGENKVSSNFYNFSWWHLGWGGTGRNGYSPEWDFTKFATEMKPFQESKKISPELMTNFLSNHDTARAISRWGSETIFWKEAAKTHALMMFSLKGIPCMYYGEEIGMLNPGFKSKDEFRDVDAMNAYTELVEKKKIYTEDEMTKYIAINGRDNARTPMQWNSKTNAGFNKGAKTWIKVGDTYETINVESQVKDPKSILSFYKELIKLRTKGKFKDVLVNGTSKFKLLKNNLFEITRETETHKIVTFINMVDARRTFKVPANSKVLLRSWSDNKKIGTELRSFESIMFEVKKGK